jgi:uncharacterized protein (TIGR02246 family)
VDSGQSRDSEAIRAQYFHLLDSWNRRSAADFAALFAEDGVSIGFDGSQNLGRALIESTLRQIFTDHPTGKYVGKVRNIRLLTPDVGLLRAVAGMVPAGQSDVSPQLNTLQSLVVSSHEGWWLIELFQNTPAQFHGRPELAAALTEELRQLL